jgi:hypothetical protein
MENHLATLFTHVELQTVAFAFVLFGEQFAYKNEMCDEVAIFFLKVFDARDGFAWNY